MQFKKKRKRKENADAAASAEVPACCRAADGYKIKNKRDSVVRDVEVKNPESVAQSGEGVIVRGTCETFTASGIRRVVL